MGKTFGEILVDGPEVYGRERLVRDRLDQEAWLLKQLEESDKQEFGYQALVDARRFEGFSAGLAVSADPTVGLYRAESEGRRADLEREEELARLQHRIEVAKLEKELAALGEESTEASEDGGGSTSSAPSEESNAPTGLGLTAPSANASTLGENASKYLPAAVAAASTAKATPVERFRERFDYREEIRQHLLENNLDDVHDLLGNTLYRFQFDTTVLPYDDTSAWARVEVTLQTPKIECGDETSRSRLRPIYRRWLKSLTGELDGARQELVWSSSESSGALLLLEEAVQEDPGIASTLPAIRSQSRRPVAGVAPTDASSLLRESLDRIAQGRRSLGQVNATRDTVLDELASRIVRDEFQNEIDPDATFVQFQVNQDPVRRSAVEPAGGNGLMSFCVKATKGAQIRGYSVTPKESAERISRNAGTRSARELALSLGLIAGTVGLEGAAKQSRIAEILQQASDRQPLIVGYGHSSGDNGVEKPTMGWILGPRFKLRNDGRGFDLRHRPIQNTLSAVASVPAWLPWLTVTVDTKWQPENGTVAISTGARPQTYDVDLPGDPQAITHAFYPRARKPEGYFFNGMEPALEIGRSETFPIFGTDLWRNPVVIVGNQKSDKIEVLPDMEGLLATFNKIQVPAGWLESQKSGLVEAWVWTSEGRVSLGSVTLFRPDKKPEEKGPEPGFKLTVQTERVLLVPATKSASVRFALDLPTKPPEKAISKVTLELIGADWDQQATAALGGKCIDPATLVATKSCQGELVIRNVPAGQSFELRAYREEGGKKIFHPAARIRVEQ